MLDEIIIDGQPFLAARRAAAMVGISPDYLTRWCREGLVQARPLAGGIWFVNLQSLKQHLVEKEARKKIWRARLAQQRQQEQRGAFA